MAFPGTYNFSYYKGDTLEFNIYPKTSNGEAFDLTTFDNVVFTAARNRGASSEDLINLVASFAPDRSYINCKILPNAGLNFSAGTPYVYDVQINDGQSVVYTLLTGVISITEQISPNPTPPSIITIPGPPLNFVLSEDPAGTISANWDAPETGDDPTQYNVYGKAPGAIVPITDYVPLFSVSAPITEFSADSITILGTEYPLQTGVEYFIKVTASNTAGENTENFVEDSITLEVPETVPGQVQNLIISATDFFAGTRTLTWSEPASGAEVTSYLISYNDNPTEGDGAEDFVNILPPLSAETLSYDFTGVPGSIYAFTVTAFAGEQNGLPVLVVDSLES
jgi:hypothetical protein